MLSFKQFLTEEDKWHYSHAGYIDPGGKVINGNHGDIIKNLGTTKGKAIKSGYTRFHITTDKRAYYQFDHQANPNAVHHAMKHAQEHEHHIERLHLDSKHHALDNIASKLGSPGHNEKISHLHSQMKHWLDN